jgi:uncharacterized membrane protein YfcA
MKPAYQSGMAIAVGAGIGAAIGVAHHDIPVWTAVGAGLGAALGAYLFRRAG